MRPILLACLILMVFTRLADAKLITRTLQYKVDETTFISYLAYDDAEPGKRPGVLVFPEWWGMVEFPKQKAEELAKLGYVAMAVDMYGQGRATEDPKLAGNLVAELQPVQLRQRAAAALEMLRKEEQIDGTHIAAIGFCFGGKVALELAYSGADIRAAVSFHSDLTPPSPEDLKKIKAHILVCTGAVDPMAPAQKVQKLWQALTDSDVVWQINVYSGAKHGFTNPAADKYNMPPVGYNALAAKQSWEAMLALFEQVLAKPPQTRPTTATMPPRR